MAQHIFGGEDGKLPLNYLFCEGLNFHCFLRRDFFQSTFVCGFQVTKTYEHNIRYRFVDIPIGFI